MKKDIFVTFFTQILVLISNLLIFKFVYVLWGKTAFADYSLIKRISSFIYSFTLMGMGVTIPRFLSINFNKKNRNNYFFAAFLVSISICITTILVLNLFKNWLSILLFNNNKYKFYMLPISLMLLGYTLHSLCYAYFRGIDKISKSNKIQIKNMAMIPIIALIFSESFKSYLYFIGFSWTTIGFVISLYIFKNINLRLQKNTLILYIKKTFFYAIQRLPADMLIGLLLSLPVIFMSHLKNTTEAGYLAFGISILNMSSSLFSSIGIVLLTKIGILLSKEGIFSIINILKKICFISLTISTTMALLISKYGDIFINLYFGNTETSLVKTVQIVILSLPGYTAYIILRNVNNVLYETNVNIISLIISITAILIGFKLNHVTISIPIAFYLLGLTNILFVYLRLRKD